MKIQDKVPWSARKKEYHRAYNKAYFQKPEVKAKLKEYRAKPEAIAKAKARCKAYSQRPEVIARRKAPCSMRKPFYQKYGMTMTEMGRLTGVSKEAIRLRFLRGGDVTKPRKKTLPLTI